MIYIHLFFCRLLDRDHVDAKEVSLDDEEENGFLKNFKVFFFLFLCSLVFFLFLLDEWLLISCLRFIYISFEYVKKC